MTLVVLIRLPLDKPLTKKVAIGASTAEEDAINMKLSVNVSDDLGHMD